MVLIVVAAGTALVLGTVATVAVVLLRARVAQINETKKITALVTDFTAAIDTADRARLAELLCPAEAAELDNDEIDIHPESDDPIQVAPEDRMRVSTSKVWITGDTATAQVTVTGQDPVTLHFRKHERRWTVCDPAAGQPAASPSPS